jgi:hypothetical protein
VDDRKLNVKCAGVAAGGERCWGVTPALGQRGVIATDSLVAHVPGWQDAQSAQARLQQQRNIAQQKRAERLQVCPMHDLPCEMHK